MIVSAKPFLISEQNGVDVHHLDDGQWIFNVHQNGWLKVAFLQMTEDLKADIILDGIGARCDINCGYLLNDNNNINMDIHVIHQSQETTSKQVIKGLATDNSSVQFNGTITIPFDSQKCDGQQNHRGILLSDKASISATPQLEIWADDVKCSHGSAVGPLDTDQLFYLQTRGLNESQARKILLSSYFNDLMPEEFNSMIQDWMDKYV